MLIHLYKQLLNLMQLHLLFCRFYYFYFTLPERLLLEIQSTKPYK
jgi:hypothetical protein